MTKSLYCINLDSTLRIENNGSCRGCCLQTQTYKDGDKIEMNVKTHSFEEIINSPTKQEILKDLNNGIPHEACNACWNEEAAGRISKRQRDNKNFQKSEKGVSVLDISLSNVCNLKCRTCNVHKSSLWKEETWDLGLYDKKKIYTRDQYNKFLTRYTKSYDDSSLFWEEFEKNIENVTQIDFYGGEPFLVTKQWELVEKIVKQGFDKNIKISYNTNGTLLDLHKFNLLKNFKSVKIDFSLDGVYNRLNYMRYPTKHETVLRNLQDIVQLKKSFNNLEVDICHTVSIMNIFYIDEVFREFGPLVGDIYFNLVHSPAHYCISNIPHKIRQQVLTYINNIPTELIPNWKRRQLTIFLEKHEADIDKWKTCWEKVKMHDEYRKQSYLETFPEFSEICKEDVVFSKIMT